MLLLCVKHPYACNGAATGGNRITPRNAKVLDVDSRTVTTFTFDEWIHG